MNVAIILGISDYKSIDLDDLPSCKNDAEIFLALTENETLDVLYIRNDKYDKKFLSDGAYNKQVALKIKDEVGGVLYLKSKVSDELKAEAYWMNKVEKSSSTF